MKIQTPQTFSTSTDDKLKILHIAAWGRSGSTILGKILGEVGGFFFGGELYNIWDYFLLKHDMLCGCGEIATDCHLWQSVFENAFGGFEQVNAKEMERFGRYVAQRHHVMNILMSSYYPYSQDELKPYLRNLERLYWAIQSSTKCKVVVDSSKRPAYAYLLGLIPSFELYVIHLVRDPRAVAYSWLRTKIQQEVRNKRIYMQKFNPITTAVRWNIRNIAVEFFWPHKFPRHLLVRYEDFIGDPQETIRQILALLQENPTRQPIIVENNIKLGENHTVRGNPNRFRTGTVSLRLDEEWKENMKQVHRSVVSVLTLPFLIRYGYF